MSSNGNVSQQNNSGLSKYGLRNSELSEKEWKQIYTRVKNIVPEGFTDDQIATLVVESRGDDFIIEQYINKWLEGNSLGEDEWKSTKKTKETRKTHNSSYRSNEYNSNKSDEKRSNKHNNSSRSSDETPRSYSKSNNNNNKSRYPSHNNTSRQRPRPIYEEPVEPIESVESAPVSTSVSVVVNTPPGVYNAWLDDSKLTMAQRIALKNQKKENKPKKVVAVVEPEVIPEPESVEIETETTSNTETQEEVAEQEQIENIIETIESETLPVEETVVIESVPTETTEPVVEEQTVESVEEEQIQEEVEPEVVEQIIEEVPVETEQEEETFVPPSFSLGHWSTEEEGSDVEFGEVDYVPEESIPVPEVIAVEETVVEAPAPVVEETIRETYVPQEESQVQDQPSVSMTAPVNTMLPETATAASIIAQDSDIIEQQMLQETLPASVSTPVKEPETLPVSSPAPVSVSNKTVPPVFSNTPSAPMNNGMYTPNTVSNNGANTNNAMGNPMFYDNHYQGMMGPYYNYMPMDNNNNNMYMNGMMPPVDTTNTPPPGLNRASANDTNNANDMNNNMNNPNNVYYNNNMNPPMNIYPGYFPYFYNNTFRMPNYRNGNNDMNYNDSTYVNHDNTATNTTANTNAHKSYNDNTNNRHNNNNNNGSQMYPNPYLYQQNYMYPQMSYPQPHY